ncbi:MAG: hypothetical protein HZA54_18145 [Planctomycetes bacterium]|nr:hypothetical protein [Planctomycetota bacterium]
MRSRASRTRQPGLLAGARVYLSGPMDFVASRAEEALHGWRARIGRFLQERGAVVFDPWNNPAVRGLHEYGREGANTTAAREGWTFADSPAGAKTRAGITGKFWETLHIDLRMVDTCDFVIAYCPTSVYSVGTVHEIALCRQQRKPVLLVSPPIRFPALEVLREHVAGDARAVQLLEQLEREVPIKPNPAGIPSLWYMPLVGGEGFFDGFGFNLPPYRAEFRGRKTDLDERERLAPPRRPLLPFLERLEHVLPRKWDNRRNRYVRNDDWLLWDLRGLDQPSAPARGKGRRRTK